MSRSYWDRAASRYDLAMTVLGGPLPRVRALLAEALADAGEVLEVAAGTGQFTETLAAASRSVVATDDAPEMVARLRFKVRALKNVRCDAADVYTLPFADGRFDAAVAANVLHLLPDVPSAVRSLARVVKPGGSLLLPTYCHGETLTSRQVSRLLSLTGFPGERRYSTATLCEDLERSGLSIARVETVPGLLPIAFVRGVYKG
jgi:phosphatidylethanolamine/phosphatidyl-N-methylethanolamine N-methyltransferase